jgi:hypothetical protein
MAPPGVWVRVATACAVATLVVGCGTVGPSAPAGTGSVTGRVTGQVVAGPTCPVETLQSPCPPRAVPDALVELLRGGRTVASVRTDGRGQFSIAAPAGAAVVRASTVTGYRSQASQPVQLTAGTTVTIRLVLDTGIR